MLVVCYSDDVKLVLRFCLVGVPLCCYVVVLLFFWFVVVIELLCCCVVVMLFC